MQGPTHMTWSFRGDTNFECVSSDPERCSLFCVCDAGESIPSRAAILGEHIESCGGYSVTRLASVSDLNSGGRVSTARPSLANSGCDGLW